MELFEQIRREYEHGVGTIKGVAQKFGIHRRMVREAIGSAVPKPRKKAEREKPKMAAAIPLIEAILEADQKAPRKQRHTAHRIWCRLKAERPEADVAESTVREYVREAEDRDWGWSTERRSFRRRITGARKGRWTGTKPTPRSTGNRQKAYVFCMRSMASGGAFHRAYPHASQQAFLEAHELAFAYFGGVFRVLRYDNLKSAVKQILRGHNGKRRSDSLRSGRTGDLRRSFARRRRARERRRGGRRTDTSGGIIWCRYLRRGAGTN